LIKSLKTAAVFKLHHLVCRRLRARSRNAARATAALSAAVKRSCLFCDARHINIGLRLGRRRGRGRDSRCLRGRLLRTHRASECANKQARQQHQPFRLPIEFKLRVPRSRCTLSLLSFKALPSLSLTRA
jgi:hypothetical protein